jgi:hypothetical protein
MLVQVRLAGVDDPEALQDFSLVITGKVLAPLPAARVGADACRTVTVAEQSCTLGFDTSAADTSARVLLLRRGEDQRRWVLA